MSFSWRGKFGVKNGGVKERRHLSAMLGVGTIIGLSFAYLSPKGKIERSSMTFHEFGIAVGLAFSRPPTPKINPFPPLHNVPFYNLYDKSLCPITYHFCRSWPFALPRRSITFVIVCVIPCPTHSFVRVAFDCAPIEVDGATLSSVPTYILMLRKTVRY